MQWNHLQLVNISLQWNVHEIQYLSSLYTTKLVMNTIGCFPAIMQQAIDIMHGV